MIKIDNFTYEELENELTNIGLKKFRANQIFHWIHGKNINEFDNMTNLSKKIRSILKDRYEINKLRLLKRFDSNFDETKKYLFLLEDNNIIESVFLKYSYGITACISTQVGCKMGCSFCASTKNGFIRNLSSGEILSQIYEIQKDTNEKVSNVVIMGSGEPFENYINVKKFIETIHNENGQNISYRKITLSTCGIVPSIYNFAEEKIPITLAISLHSANQEKREKIIPIAKKYRLPELMSACDFYTNQTNRRITYEYIMIEDFNDYKNDAELLILLLKNRLCNVNLIPYNSIHEKNFRPSKNLKIEKFKKILESANINVTIRRELGSDINAACGQLRNDFLKK